MYKFIILNLLFASSAILSIENDMRYYRPGRQFGFIPSFPFITERYISDGTEIVNIYNKDKLFAQGSFNLNDRHGDNRFLFQKKLPFKLSSKKISPCTTIFNALLGAV